MDTAIIEYLINIIVLVPVVLILIVISLKLSRKGLDKITINSYTEVLERSNLNKETSLYVIKTGKTGCVLVSSQNNMQVIKELDEDEIQEIIKMKKEKNNTVDFYKIPHVNIRSIINKKNTKEKDYGHIK